MQITSAIQVRPSIVLHIVCKKITLLNLSRYMQGYGPVNQGAKGGYHISQQKKVYWEM